MQGCTFRHEVEDQRTLLSASAAAVAHCQLPQRRGSTPAVADRRLLRPLQLPSSGKQNKCGKSCQKSWGRIFQPGASAAAAPEGWAEESPFDGGRAGGTRLHPVARPWSQFPEVRVVVRKSPAWRIFVLNAPHQGDSVPKRRVVWVGKLETL